MYPLLPWKLISTALGAAIALAVYADDLAKMIGYSLPESLVVRYLPLAILTFVGLFFGPTGYWSPWRIVWRTVPPLNGWAFPDLNGVWVGRTKSNWPIIEKAYDAATSHRSVTEAELYGIPLKEDAIAVSIRCSLFTLKIKVATSATDGESHSIAARPSRDSLTGCLHVINVYRQSVPDPARTDEPVHLGAADLKVDPEEPEQISGEYWTRRVWRTGKNTAGKIELRRLPSEQLNGRTLRQFAANEKKRIS
ncbi:MAG: hypothetical protein CFE33_20330 [Pseudorhodobacter sp. PARRP1]|nr:MAG: hypothetical protein CFE33_20330 [Pseudorhodobacter sp. PARRP1]